jgi:hypothetical protein
MFREQRVRACLDDEVGRPELPLPVPCRRPRQQRGITFEETVVHPSLQRGDLLARQSPLVQEFPVARLRLPRGHQAIARRGDDGRSVALHFVVGQ